jgi:hypothetical protein
MKIKITLFSLSIIFTTLSFGQLFGLDSTFIYKEDGNKEWYHIQKDVYCFKLDSDTEYNGGVNSCVSVLDYWNNTATKFNEICFSPNSSTFSRAIQVNAVQGMPDYSISSYALTKSADSTFEAQKYYRTDDQIMVTFNDPLLSNSVIDNFKSTYSLEMVYEPPFANLSNTVSWAYTFKIIPLKGLGLNTIDLAQKINENEVALVKLAEPNMYATTSLACTPTTEMGFTPSGTRGTWHLDNPGGVIWSGYSGIADADADICECWGEGYTGSGIKVGVIDFGGIEFTHPDFSGINMPEAYNAVTGLNHTSNFYLNQNNAHAMKVTGVVGATPNNTGLGFRWAAGAAYDAQIKPYIVEDFGVNTSVSNAQIAQSIIEAISNGMDVINMSFRTDAGVGTIDSQINNGVLTGRPDGNGGFNGIVFVAAVGNHDIDASNFPANMPNVIGVGWSNPEDYRSAYTSPAPNGGSWTTVPGEGSTYGNPSYNYDVVAPGEVIITTNMSTVGGPYINDKGSSFASPIVASIAAILLQKDPTLNYNVVKTRIRAGAEKVHNSTYNYNMFGTAPGYNNEMFYGRVSCINSLNSTASTSETNANTELTVIRQDNNQYLVYIPLSNENQNYQIYDISGRVVYNSIIQNDVSKILIDLSEFTNGMYILKINNGVKAIASTKLIK